MWQKNSHKQFMITYFNILAFVISLSNFNIFLFEQCLISSKYMYFTQYWQKCQNCLTKKTSNVRWSSTEFSWYAFQRNVCGKGRMLRNDWWGSYPLFWNDLKATITFPEENCVWSYCTEGANKFLFKDPFYL